MDIRRAGLDDAPLIAELNRAIQQLHADALPRVFKSLPAGALPVADARDIIADPSARVLIGFEGDQAVGYVYAEIVRRGPTSHRHATAQVYVHELAIQPAYHRRGYGHALIDAVKALARTEGIRTVALDVWSFNARARAFFAREGFTAFNERLWMEVG